MTAQAQDTGRKSTILVVDDVPDNLTLIGGLLEDSYRVKYAISGEKALRIAASDDIPDLILLDIVMPGLDGLTEPPTQPRAANANA